MATGDVAHRIELPGRNEFTCLAKNFNDMTQQLARQREHLLAAQIELENKVDSCAHELYSRQINSRFFLLNKNIFSK